MLTALSKEETIKLEQSSTPLENILSGIFQETKNPIKTLKNRKKFQKSLDQRMEIQFWYEKFGIGTNDPIRTHWVALEKLLGYKATIYRNYEYRNAIWGLQYKETKFLVWKSIRGTEFTLKSDTAIDQGYELLSYLHKLMGYQWFKEMEKKHGLIPMEK